MQGLVDLGWSDWPSWPGLILLVALGVEAKASILIFTATSVWSSDKSFSICMSFPQFSKKIAISSSRIPIKETTSYCRWPQKCVLADFLAFFSGICVCAINGIPSPFSVLHKAFVYCCILMENIKTWFKKCRTGTRV